MTRLYVLCLHQWTSDESYCMRLVTNAIEVYEGRSLEKGFVGKVAAPGLVSMAVSPSPRLPVKVAAFTPETSGRPASVRVHQFPPVASASPASKAFYNAQECELDWAPNGKAYMARACGVVNTMRRSLVHLKPLFFFSKLF